MLGDSTGAAGQLVTAVKYTATNSYVGTTFSGGFYVEADLKFDPKAVAAASAINAWPRSGRYNWKAPSCQI